LIKKLTDPDSHPVKQLVQFEIQHPQSRHPSPIHSILDHHHTQDYHLDQIETIRQHLINPWEDFQIETNNIKIKKEDAKQVVEDQLEEMTSNNKHILFTDGSSIPENGTTSEAILNQSISTAYHIGNHQEASAFEAEVHAVKIGLNTILNKFYNPLDNFRYSSKKLNIFIDNQETVLTIARPPKPTSNQSTFYNIYNKMKLLIDLFDYKITPFGCPANINIPENKAVDNLAKSATEQTYQHQLTDPERTLSNIQQIFCKHYKFNKKKQPIKCNNITLLTYPIKIFTKLKTLERGKSSIIYQL
jgi:ribonuclease HI